MSSSAAESERKEESDGAFTRRHWRVDRHHSNFFTRWLADSAHIKRYNLPVSRQREWGGSRYDQNVAVTLQQPDRSFWFEKEKTYGDFDDLEKFEPDRVVQITNSVYVDELDLPANSVSMIEVIPGSGATPVHHQQGAPPD